MTVAEIKDRVDQLEIELGHKEAPIPPPAYHLELAGESYENLGRIYQQGYHICPVAFGQVRYEECLFCIAFLKKE